MKNHSAIRNGSAQDIDWEAWLFGAVCLVATLAWGAFLFRMIGF